MEKGDKRLMWDGKRNWPVTLHSKVNGGWLVQLENGMLCGPVEEGPATLR